MPGVETPLWVDVLLVLGAGAAALTAIVKAWTTAVLPYLVRPVVTAVAAAVETGVDRMVVEHLVPIKAELRTNGGSSLKDAVLRIEQEQEKARRLQVALSDYTHRNFNAIITHLTLKDQADPALQALRDRIASADDTGELKKVLREELPDVFDGDADGSY